jgi:small-conductance mechanosensitive channel
MSEHILFVLKRIVNAIIFLFAFLIILYVLQIDLSGIVIGLGVGGIAIAFALQNVLSDIFSAFSIYFDRPFEIGDFIVIGEYSGTVKKIGMKSTRVKLLQGEELVLANSVLTTTNVRNFKKMRKRRIKFNFGVTYDTSSEKLKKIPNMVSKIIEKNKLTNIDRIHFKEFGDFSLNFEVIYYINSKDYAKYMDVQQEINFAIKEAFEKVGIEMAYPTQTIFLNKEI